MDEGVRVKRQVNLMWSRKKYYLPIRVLMINGRAIGFSPTP